MNTEGAWPDRSVGHLAAVGVGIAAPIVLEVWFLGKYAAQAASWHWYVHFVAGATLALVLMTRWSWHHRRAVPFPLVWLVLAHFYAAAPDLVIPENVPHKPWQEVFVGHLASHYLPGRGLSWLVVFAVALAGYLLALNRRMAPPLVPDGRMGRGPASRALTGSRVP